jgi:hypothetical protein
MVNIIEKIQEINKFNLNNDHAHHSVLFNAALAIQNVEGIVCEIGLRGGGGLALMMLACIENGNTDRKFLAIDPYGNIEYHWKENAIVRFDYTNSMKLTTMKSLSDFCLHYGIDFNLYCLEDTEFFKRFGDGVPFYNEVKQVLNTYALVHLDGPHAVLELQQEISFFKDKMAIGGIIVLDDVTNYYSLPEVESLLLNDGSFKNIENDGVKSSYIRIK